MMWANQGWQAWPLQQAAYQNIPSEEVDWAALAKQWISHRQEEPETESLPLEKALGLPPPPPPPDEPPGEGATDGDGGEGMDISDDESEQPNMSMAGAMGQGMGVAGGFPDINQRLMAAAGWGWNDGNWNKSAPGWGTPPLMEQYGQEGMMMGQMGAGDYQSFHGNHADQLNYNKNFDSSQAPYWHEGMEEQQPRRQRRRSEYNRRGSRYEADGETGVGTDIDAAKRKSLPLWIREGLERMEREKMKNERKEREITAAAEAVAQQEKQKSEGKIAPSDDDHNTSIKSKFDSDDDEPAPPISQTSQTPPAPALRSAMRQREPSPEIYKTEEEKQQEFMMKVRRMLTEVLMEVTNEEITDISRQVYTKSKKRADKAPATQIAKSTGLASIKSLGLGVGLYGSDSDSGSESDTGAKAGGNSSVSESEPETVIDDRIRRKKRDFERKHQHIMDELDEEEKRLKTGKSVPKEDPIPDCQNHEPPPKNKKRWDEMPPNPQISTQRESPKKSQDRLSTDNMTDVKAVHNKTKIATEGSSSTSGSSSSSSSGSSSDSDSSSSQTDNHKKLKVKSKVKASKPEVKEVVKDKEWKFDRSREEKSKDLDRSVSREEKSGGLDRSISREEKSKGLDRSVSKEEKVTPKSYSKTRHKSDRSGSDKDHKRKDKHKDKKKDKSYDRNGKTREYSYEDDEVRASKHSKYDDEDIRTPKRKYYSDDDDDVTSSKRKSSKHSNDKYKDKYDDYNKYDDRPRSDKKVKSKEKSKSKKYDYDSYEEDDKYKTGILGKYKDSRDSRSRSIDSVPDKKSDRRQSSDKPKGKHRSSSDSRKYVESSESRNKDDRYYDEYEKYDREKRRERRSRSSSCSKSSKSRRTKHHDSDSDEYYHRSSTQDKYAEVESSRSSKKSRKYKSRSRTRSRSPHNSKR